MRPVRPASQAELVHGLRQPIATFLHKGDADYIHADQERETANGNGEVDLMHGDFGSGPI